MEEGIIALTVAAVPTGINVGVSILPCFVIKLPHRASPSVLSTEKGSDIIHNFPS